MVFLCIRDRLVCISFCDAGLGFVTDVNDLTGCCSSYIKLFSFSFVNGNVLAVVRSGKRVGIIIAGL